MHSNNMLSALATLAMAGSAAAHATMFGAWVNDVDQGAGKDTYIRSPPNNSPVKDLTSPDLVCNVNGGKVAPEFISAAAGDKLTFEWQHDNRGDDIIAASHQGPIITYIAPFTEDNGAGPIWTKIAEDGFDGSKWAVDKLIANKGKQDFTLPEALAAGKYLIRQEIIAHHESETAFDVNPARGAQFYPSCVQVEVTSGGDAVPDQAFDFNTGYTYQDPGIVFNIYNFNGGSYSIPGPEVWTGAGAGGGGSGGSPTAPKPTATAAPTQAPEPTATVPVDATPAPSLTTLSTAVKPTATAAPEVPETPAPETPAPGDSEDGEGCKLKRRSRKHRRSVRTRHIAKMI